MTVSTLLSKSGESNTFIKEDVEHALSSVVNNVNSVKAMGAFINGGAGYVYFITFVNQTFIPHYILP